MNQFSDIISRQKVTLFKILGKFGKDLKCPNVHGEFSLCWGFTAQSTQWVMLSMVSSPNHMFTGQA